MLARAYAAFANDGKLPTTHFIRKIVDASGETVVDNSHPATRQIMSKKVAQEMTSMMIGTFNEGTGKRLNRLAIQLLVKLAVPRFLAVGVMAPRISG